jgi:hypothetical protein
MRGVRSVRSSVGLPSRVGALCGKIAGEIPSYFVSTASQGGDNVGALA